MDILIEQLLVSIIFASALEKHDAHDSNLEGEMKFKAG